MKLYWRVKVNGKWTWKAATVVDVDIDANHITVDLFEEAGR